MTKWLFLMIGIAAVLSITGCSEKEKNMTLGGAIGAAIGAMASD